MDEFDQWALLSFTRAGISPGSIQMDLVRLVYDAVIAPLDALDRIDATRLPLEPIDPSRAPSE